MPENPTTVTPANGVMPLHNWDDWRALFHQLVPVVVTALVGVHMVTEDQVALWLPFVIAIADNLLSAGNTTDRIRRAIYAGLTVAQSSSLITTLLVDNPYTPLITAGLTVVQSILSRFYNPTSTMLPEVRTTPYVPEDVA